MKTEFFFEIDYTNADNISQAQVLASFIQDITLDEFSMKNLEKFYNIPLPNGFVDWKGFYDFCVLNKSKEIFHIKTHWGTVRSLCGTRLLPTSLLYFFLNALENSLNKIKKIKVNNNNIDELMKTSQCLAESYLLLNSYIETYFFNLLYDYFEDHCHPDLHPVIINIEHLKFIKNLPVYVKMCRDIKTFKRPYKLILMEFACQCNYLSFILTLITFVNCCTLPKAATSSVGNLLFCLLSNFKTIFVHYIKVENSDLNVSKVIDERGATDKTTRIKFFFTLNDGKPMVARLDLPHKGVLDLHINVSDENGEHPYNHCKLQSGKVSDDILKPLEEALITFAPEGLDWSSFEKEDDANILKKIKLERALFAVSMREFTKAIHPQNYTDKHSLDDKNSEKELNLLRDSYAYIRSSLDFPEQEKDRLNDTEIYELVCDDVFNIQ